MLYRFVVEPDPMKKQIEDYLNATATVSSYVYAFNRTNLPKLKVRPKWYQEFEDQFGLVRVHVGQWFDITEQMKLLPQSLIGFNAYFQDGANSIQMSIEALLSNPGNQELKKSLLSTLSNLGASVHRKREVLVNLQNMVKAFESNLGPDAKILSSLARQAIDGARANEAEVKKILADVNELQKEIRSSTKYLRIGAIGIGVSVLVSATGVVLTALTGPLGLIVLGVGLFGVGASILGTVLASRNVQSLQRQIAAAQKNMDQLKQDAVSLRAISDSFNQVVASNLQAQQAIGDIVGFWNILDQDLRTTVRELEEAKGDVLVNKLGTALQNVKAAEAAWSEVDGFAQVANTVTYEYDPKVHLIPEALAA